MLPWVFAENRTAKSRSATAAGARIPNARADATTARNQRTAKGMHETYGTSRQQYT
jgi:hypothetical protein